MPKITISTTIQATPEQVYQSYLNPEDNQQWNTAGYGWSTGFVNIDARVGGRWEAEYKSLDGKNDFIFGGVYTDLVENKLIKYLMDDGRVGEVAFEIVENGTKVTITFDAEGENSLEQQETGWQLILENFKKFVERKVNPHNQALKKSIQINATKEKTWKAIVDKDNYRAWTMPFMDGGYWEGEIKYNSNIKFMSPDGTGLSSLIKVCIPGFQLSFEHLGFFEEGNQVDFVGDHTGWKGARETYTLNYKDGITTLDIYQDLPKTEAEFFDAKWEDALKIIKQIAEK